MGDVVGLDGQPWNERCTATAASTGQRCQTKAAVGMTVCWRHGAGRAAELHPDAPKSPRQIAMERVERVKARLQEAGDQAVQTVMAVLQDEEAKPADRLKAAELVLGRVVGAKVEVAHEDEEHRDIDAKLEAVIEGLKAERQKSTGTEG